MDRLRLRTEERSDGKSLLRSSEERLSTEEVARGYKSAVASETGASGPQAHGGHRPHRPLPQGPHPAWRAVADDTADYRPQGLVTLPDLKPLGRYLTIPVPGAQHLRSHYPLSAHLGAPALRGLLPGLSLCPPTDRRQRDGLSSFPPEQPHRCHCGYHENACHHPHFREVPPQPVPRVLQEHNHVRQRHDIRYSL